MRKATIVRALRSVQAAVVLAGILLVAPPLVPGALADPPPPSVLVSPSGAITSPTPTYTWNVASGATRYYVVAETESSIAFQGLYTSAEVCSGPTCAVVGSTLAAGSYTWYVESQNSAGKTWSDGMGFTVQAPPAPTLISPSGASSNPTPTYTWNTSSGATQYFLQVGNGSAIVGQGLYTTAEVCSGATCSMTLSSVLTVGSYWWAVEAQNSAGKTWSPSMSFSVQGPPAPVLVSPSGATSNPTPTYTWNVSSGATQYYVQVGNGSAIVFQGLYTTAQVCSGSTCAVQGSSLVAGSYSWAVEAQNAAGKTWSASMSFTVQAPPAPVLVSPSGAIANPTPTYTWNVSPGATQYYLQVGNGTAIVFQGLYTSQQVCPGSTCAVLGNTLAVGSYWWAVEAQNSAGRTWSASMNFSIQELPPPIPLSPNGPLTNSSPTYTWDASAGATQYFLRVENSVASPVFQGLFDAAAVCSNLPCIATPGVVLSTGAYTWSVQAKNAAGGTWSATLSFSVGADPNEVVRTGDFNGDGRTDRLSSGGGATYVALSTGTGFQTGASWLSHAFANPLLGDFDSDGRSDVAEFDAATGVFSVALSTGAAFSALQPWGTASATQDGQPRTCVASSAEAGTGDFNGDGRTDVSCKLSGWDGVFVGLSSGTNSFTFSIFGNAFCEAGERTGTLDMNGDGKDDWYCLGKVYGALLVFSSTGTTFAPVGISAGDASFCDDVHYLFGDFNGDGRTDLSCTSNGKVRLSTGSAYLPPCQHA